MRDATNRLKALPAILTWEDAQSAGEWARRSWDAQLQLMSCRLAETAAAHPPLRTALDRLTDPALLRLVRAPEICHALTVLDDPSRHAFILAAAEAEARLAGGDATSDVVLWTALGDHQVDPEGVVVYRAPTFRGFVVDVCSPYANRALEVSNFRPAVGYAARFGDAELKEVLFRIYAAVECLSASAPAAFDFTAALVRTVMPRVDELTPTFKGSSNMTLLGRVNLFNPHLAIVDHSAIATSLVHEAVHLYLYTCESDVSLVEARDLAHNSRVLSPWSGKQIHLRAYLHATCVWFGLYRFWLPQERLDAFSPAVRDHFLRLSSRGFAGHAALSTLAPWMDHIHPDMRDVLHRIQDQMVGA